MRAPDEIPKIVGEAKDYAIPRSIGGAEYLEVPADDLRWHVCFDNSHPSNCELPVVFFEVLANRLAITDDLHKFLGGIALPIQIRRYFQGKENLEKLKLYVNELLETFPAIINRAGWLLDEAALAGEFQADFKKEDLKSFYTKVIQQANARDVPVIGAALSKLEGWDAPEKHQIATVSEVRHILDTVVTNERLPNSLHCPLPPPLPHRELT